MPAGVVAPAGIDPELWKVILAANRTEVLAALRGYQAELGRAADALAAGEDDQVAALLEKGRAYRAGLRVPSP